MLNAKKKRALAIWQTVLDTLSGTPVKPVARTMYSACHRENRFTNNTAALGGNASLLTLKDE
ncbi:hypothetical protein LCGC14_0098090 [marine sediment metagenome]|uniref:Uncharacterized protein n=1 Tax=marine sediment metagenome TaxID=412755 RepID=A0A0F9VE14_9ZZZZ|nr:hypothetical protein [Halomonas sp.]HDZ45695.1 hypothetical protein [Halomonas sp.]HEB03993.1 hypothetical protein [Halomonas sp.]